MVEREHEIFARALAGNRDVEHVRQGVLLVSVDDNVRDARDNFARQIVAQYAQTVGFRITFTGNLIKCRRESRGKRHVFRAAAKSPFLPAAEYRRGKRCAIVHIETSDAAWPVEFARTERKHVHSERMYLRRTVQRRLSRITVEKNVYMVLFFICAQSQCNCGERLHGAYLVVAPAHGHENGCGAQKRGDTISADNSLRVRLHIRDRTSHAFDFRKTLQHRRMFNLAYY